MEKTLQRIREELKTKGSVVLSVRVHPRAKKTAFKDVMEDGSIKIAIKSPPEDGRANHELIEFLSEIFKVPPSQISVLSGTTARMKKIRIRTYP